jgi:membrane protein YdbS with pleckstrin-like domain
MKGYKYFTEQGSQYVMKKRYAFALVISIIFASFACGGYLAHLPAVMWGAAVLEILFLVSIARESVLIDLERKEIVTTKGLFARKTIIPLPGIQHFEMVRMTYTLITVSTSINAWYIHDGKEKVALISNGLTRRAMQHLLNEIEEIIKHAGYPAAV